MVQTASVELPLFDSVGRLVSSASPKMWREAAWCCMDAVKRLDDIELIFSKFRTSPRVGMSGRLWHTASNFRSVLENSGQLVTSGAASCDPGKQVMQGFFCPILPRMPGQAYFFCSVLASWMLSVFVARASGIGLDGALLLTKVRENPITGTGTSNLLWPALLHLWGFFRKNALVFILSISNPAGKEASPC